MRCRAALCCVAITLLLPRLSFGWGKDGHEIVARIAESRIGPHARAAVADLLDGKSLADIASWADDIRKQRDETGPWHFVDIPYEMQGFDETRDGKQGNNVVDQLMAQAAILNDRTAARDKRTEALKFVVHFAGDIEQPLHCAERNDDKGGNFRLVFFLDQPKAMNLHHVWDTEILDEAMKEENQTSAKDFASTLAAQITPKMADNWLGGNPTQWANESHALAVSVVYANVPADGPPPKLDVQYVQTAIPVVKIQLQRGGMRLAALLDRVFP